MTDIRLFIVFIMIGMVMMFMKVLMEWSIYKFNKKCDMKIRHLKLKERYEMLKRLTR